MNEFNTPGNKALAPQTLPGTWLAIPLRLRGHRSHLTLSRNGCIFYVMLLALLLGSINHNSNLGYLLTFLLGSISLVSVFHTVWNISGITIVSARAEPVFAGQKASFTITADPSLRDRPAVSFSFQHGQLSTAALRKEETHNVNVQHDTEERGILCPQVLFISTLFPLGLFHVWSHVPFDACCLLYPRPIPGPMITSRGNKKDENEGEAGGPGVEDFSGLETYQPGDPPQHISWKTYSRGQGLHTKKFEGQHGKTIIFNPDELPGNDIEVKLSRICSMIIQSEGLQLVYGVQLGNKFIAPGQGGSHLRQCMRELALFDKDGE